MKNQKLSKIKVLKHYFNKKSSVILAFVFGSQSKNLERNFSDWDIAVYFKPKKYLELETKENYFEENKIWSDLVDILKTDNIDFLVLNRARPSLVYNVLRIGIPLTLKDEKLYWKLFCKTSYEAIDWWKFVEDFWKIKEKARSFTPEAKKNIIELLDFLEEQFKDIEKFKKLNWNTYQSNRDERRNIERWVENLIMAFLDIAKVILASEKREIPQSYKDILKIFIAFHIISDEKTAEKFSEFAKLRNIVAHEYLDLKWEKIKNFIKEAEKLYPQLFKKVKKIIK
ncbi:MAG: HepT-like ribonuclease domain-containing protein [bacterium]